MYDNYSALNYRWNHSGKIPTNAERMYDGDYATKRWGDKETRIMGLFCKRVGKRYNNEGLKLVLLKFMVVPCINDMKNFIVQLMHTNYKILRILKWLKL